GVHGGTLSQSATWSLTNVSYRLFGNVTASGTSTTLSIGSGATLTTVNDFSVELRVEQGATLIANGSILSAKIVVGSASNGGGTLNSNGATFNRQTTFRPNGAGTVSNGTIGTTGGFTVEDAATPTITGMTCNGTSLPFQVYGEYVPLLSG